MKEIINELKEFLKLEWWIFIIFFICLIFIFETKTGNIWEILIVFIFHCIGDIFMMTMGKCYSSGNLRKGSIFQIMGNLTVGFIGFYSGIFNGKWNYVFSSVGFYYSSVRNYFVNVKGKKLDFLNWKLLLIIMFFVLFFYYYFGFITSFGVFIQFLGFIFFPLGLTIDNAKSKYFVSVFGIFIMTLGSIIILYESYLKGNIVGVDISFTLLPLTVCVSYLKSFKKYLCNN